MCVCELCLKFYMKRVGAVAASCLWVAAAPSLSLRADTIPTFTFLHAASQCGDVIF